jgi:hypothetical protein
MSLAVLCSTALSCNEKTMVGTTYLTENHHG